MFTDKPAPPVNLSVNVTSATDNSGLLTSTLRFVPSKPYKFLFYIRVNCSWFNTVRPSQSLRCLTVAHLLGIFKKSFRSINKSVEICLCSSDESDSHSGRDWA